MGATAWAGSSRAARLPADWTSRRAAVLERDGHTCRRCGDEATEVDHAVAGDDHRLENLQALCVSCHRAKTAREGAAARVWRPRRRPPEPHPGAAT